MSVFQYGMQRNIEVRSHAFSIQASFVFWQTKVQIDCILMRKVRSCQNLPKHFKIISGKECVTQLKLVLRTY